MFILAHLLTGSVVATSEVMPGILSSIVYGDQEQSLPTGVNRSCRQPQWYSLSKIIHYSNCEANVLRCYCLTPTNKTTINPKEVQYVIGHCLQGCFFPQKYYEYYNVSLWNGTFCSAYKRIGTLCGACKSGHGPPVYAFSLQCVECHTFWKHLFLYIVIAYGPLTLFLATIVFFTVSVNSAPLHGWIFVCQICSSSLYMRLVTRMGELKYLPKPLYQVFGTFYGIWNLDFFRSVYDPFCLHPSLTTLQVISLDYVIAAYPLVTILVMYVLVHLYSQEYRPVVILWKPFHYCCTRFRHQLNIKTSLIDAFGTFFSLSYVKFLSTTVDLVIPTLVWNENGSTSYHSYTDGTQLYFRNGHLPFGCVFCV